MSTPSKIRFCRIISTTHATNSGGQMNFGSSVLFGILKSKLSLAMISVHRENAALTKSKTGWGKYFRRKRLQPRCIISKRLKTILPLLHLRNNGILSTVSCLRHDSPPPCYDWASRGVNFGCLENKWYSWCKKFHARGKSQSCKSQGWWEYLRLTKAKVWMRHRHCRTELGEVEAQAETSEGERLSLKTWLLPAKFWSCQI